MTRWQTVEQEPSRSAEAQAPRVALAEIHGRVVLSITAAHEAQEAYPLLREGQWVGLQVSACGTMVRLAPTRPKHPSGRQFLAIGQPKREDDRRRTVSARFTPPSPLELITCKSVLAPDCEIDGDAVVLHLPRRWIEHARQIAADLAQRDDADDQAAAAAPEPEGAPAEPAAEPPTIKQYLKAAADAFTPPVIAQCLSGGDRMQAEADRTAALKVATAQAEATKRAEPEESEARRALRETFIAELARYAKGTHADRKHLATLPFGGLVAIVNRYRRERGEPAAKVPTP